MNKYAPAVPITTFAFLSLSSLTIFLPIAIESEVNWVIIYSIILVMNFVDGIIQSMLYGLSGAINKTFITSLNTGCSISGLVINSIRAFTLLSYSNETSGSSKSSFNEVMVYFIIAAIILSASSILMIHLSNTDLYKYHRRLKKNEFKKHNKTEPQINHENVGFKIEYILILVIYAQTLTVFPAVLLNGGLNFIKNESWKVWFIVTLFNLFDVIFKYLSVKSTYHTSRSVISLTLFRFIPILVAIYSPHISSDFIKVVNIIVLAATNGYIGNSVLILGITNTEDKHREIVGRKMSF